MMAMAAFALVACQNEPEGLNVVLDGEQDVIVNVVVPEAETRAGVDSAESVFGNGILGGDFTMRYILQIYDENGNPSKERLVKYSDGTSVSFSVRLVPDRGYAFVVWADVVACEDKKDLYYNTEDLKQVTVIDTDNKWNAMNEARDAFTGKSVVNNFQGTSTIDVKLTRPFAKLRVVTTDFDELAKFDIEAKKAVAIYTTKHYRTFNAYGASFDEVAGVALDQDVVNVTHEYSITKYTGETGDNHTIFTDYFFAKAGSPDIINLKLDVYEVYEDEATQRLIKSNNFNTDIPVQRNYLTTLKGDVLTTNGNVSVVVKPGFGDEIVEKYADNAETLQEIINEEAPVGEQTNITLGGDIDLNDLLNAGILSTRASEPTYGLLIPADKEVVLDLNGHTISQEKECAASYAMIENKGTLNITDTKGNGMLTFTDTSAGGGSEWGSYTINNTGTLEVSNVTIQHLGSMGDWGDNRPTCIPIQNYAGKVTVNSGVISSPMFRSLRDFTAGGEIIINGGEFKGQIWMQGLGTGSSSLTINGGEFAPTAGYDGSSVYVTNGTNDVEVAIKGGFFNTKIGCADASKAGVNGCIVGGTFTTAAKEATNEALLDGDYEFVSDDENWVVSKKAAVAKIGDVEYTSLIKAAAAVQDGETITLLANETFTNKNYSDNGGWKDGLYYVGDKSFTIDLDGKTIGQNGDLNDYLLNFKNVGSKANTITLKNGTLDAGKTAYCALCTSSSHENQLTINTENITITNNISDGSTVKVRGGAILNVKAGTKIIGKNSYLGIECSASAVNIYDGAEIYMNGTSSYNGCLAGACYGGTINVYGGYGKGVKGGFIAMTSGGTINVSGGEWIANTDGTIGDNSNLYVLTAQSNKNESGFVGGAYVNVTGGTLRGGMDAWVLNNIEGEVAELNISGGNFNANPSAYLTVGCEATESNGIWTVRVVPVAKIGETEYETLEAAAEAAENGDTIIVLKDVALSSTLTLPAGITFDGNGKQIDGTISAGGDLTFVGHTKVTSFSASYYNRVITIGEGACLEVTGTGRVTLGYGNTFHITGSVENAKTAVKEDVQPSLIIPGGISITGGNGAAMNVTNAYVKIGSTTSKPGTASGTFTLNFKNAIAEFTKEFGFYDPTGSANPTFVMNITDSVFTTGTKLFVTANSTVTVDNSNVPLGTYFRNSGTFTLTNGSVMTGATIQFGENGGNNGTINVDKSTLTITTGNNKGHAFDGQGIGKISAVNGATVSVEYYKDMTIEVDETSTFIGTNIGK